MSLRIIVVLAVLTGVTGSLSVTIRPVADSVDAAHPNSVPETVEETEFFGQVRKKLDPLASVCKCFFLRALICFLSCVTHEKNCSGKL